MTTIRLHGLVAATHTPFDAEGKLNLDQVERQAEHLDRDGIRAVFVTGTTGESASLTVDERLALAKRWSEVVRGTGMTLVVHVGSNCLADARIMASQAQALGAAAMAMLAPSYFKPSRLESLLACCASVAEAAPELPLYFYDIPTMTGVSFPMRDFLIQGQTIRTLAGLKFTNPDLMMYQECLELESGRFDVPWGVDEWLLGALAVGAKGAVGSSYNFAAPVYTRIMAAVREGHLEAARRDQLRSVQLIQILSKYGYMAASKCLMGWLGVEVGPPRLPVLGLDGTEAQLRQELEQSGFFEWGRS